MPNGNPSTATHPAIHVWLFIIDWGEFQPARMHDLVGLEDTLKRAVANHHLTGEPPAPTVYRYLGEGRTEPLVWSHVEGTGQDIVRDPDRDDAPAYRYPQYRVSGPDGSQYLTFTVSLFEH